MKRRHLRRYSLLNWKTLWYQLSFPSLISVGKMPCGANTIMVARHSPQPCTANSVSLRQQRSSQAMASASTSKSSTSSMAFIMGLVAADQSAVERVAILGPRGVYLNQFFLKPVSFMFINEVALQFPRRRRRLAANHQIAWLPAKNG